MKIGIVIGSLGMGGAERVSVRLSRWWAEHGHQVSFYTTMKAPQKEYQISEKINRYHCYHSGSKPALISRLRNTIIRDHPDIVLIMDTPMCVYAVPALLGLRIPFVVSERSDPNTSAIKRTTRILSHTLMNFASGFVFQTAGAKKYYHKGIQKRSVIIPNPLELSELPEPYKGEREHRVVAVGRLIPAKNYPLLIVAFEKFVKDSPDYTLEIFGDGALRKNIEELLEASPARNRIKLMGTHSDVLDQIRTAGMYVLSSDLEGMPNALMEAMALGLPSIATNCPSGGPASLIRSGENGILVPAGAEDALYEAMSSLAQNPALANKLGSHAVQIRNTHDISTIARKWLDYFQMV